MIKHLVLNDPIEVVLMHDDSNLMIDTIRFHGEFTDLENLPTIEGELEKLIRTKGDVTLYEFTTGSLSGSFDNRISFSIKNKEWIFNHELGRSEFLEASRPYWTCELSLHKFFLGHNIYGFDDDLSRIYDVYDFLEMTFGCSFIDRKSVVMDRIDIAEVYKYQTEEQVKKAFHCLKNMKKYRTKPSTYRDTGIYFPGSVTTFKVYDKHAEFKTHDFKKLKKIDLDLANWLYDFSKNIIRLECEIKKRKLNDMYGKDAAFVEVLIMNKIIDIKNVYLKEKQRLIFEEKNDVAINAITNVHEHLIEKLGMRKASPLYAFFLSMVTHGEQYCRDIYPQASFYRNKKTLVDMGIPFYEYGFNDMESVDNSSQKYTFKEELEIFPHGLKLIKKAV